MKMSKNGVEINKIMKIEKKIIKSRTDKPGATKEES
jgi:hypothetical protein